MAWTRSTSRCTTTAPRGPRRWASPSAWRSMAASSPAERARGRPVAAGASAARERGVRRPRRIDWMLTAVALAVGVAELAVTADLEGSVALNVVAVAAIVAPLAWWRVLAAARRRCPLRDRGAGRLADLGRRAAGDLVPAAGPGLRPGRARGRPRRARRPGHPLRGDRGDDRDRADRWRSATCLPDGPRRRVLPRRAHGAQPDAAGRRAARGGGAGQRAPRRGRPSRRSSRSASGSRARCTTSSRIR